MNEAVIVFIGTVMLIVAYLGCIVPILPGPLLAYSALLLRQFASKTAGIHYSTTTLIVMAAAMIIVFILDYVLPGYVAKKSGGSKYASNGALIGTIAGIIFTPIGMILGMFLGAFIGQMLHDSTSTSNALRVAGFSFVGFLLSTGIKFVYCGIATMFFFFP